MKVPLKLMVVSYESYCMYVADNRTKLWYEMDYGLLWPSSRMRLKAEAASATGERRPRLRKSGAQKSIHRNNIRHPKFQK